MERKTDGTVWDGLKGVFCEMQRYHKKALWLIAIGLYAYLIILIALGGGGVHFGSQATQSVQLIFKILTLLGVFVWEVSFVLLILSYFTDRSPEHLGKLIKKFLVSTLLLVWILAAIGVITFVIGNSSIGTISNGVMTIQ